MKLGLGEQGTPSPHLGGLLCRRCQVGGVSSWVRVALQATPCLSRPLSSPGVVARLHAGSSWDPTCRLQQVGSGATSPRSVRARMSAVLEPKSQAASGGCVRRVVRPASERARWRTQVGPGHSHLRLAVACARYIADAEQAEPREEALVRSARLAVRRVGTATPFAGITDAASSSRGVRVILTQGPYHCSLQLGDFPGRVFRR